MKKSWTLAKNAPESERFALQQLAREQMKERLLRDIRLDIEICHLEGWQYKQYLQELLDLISHFSGGKDK